MSSKPENPYIGIRVATLRGDIKIPFDVYVLVAGKYIHYCRAGDSFEGARLNRLRAKKLKKMYIRPDDQSPYEQYLEQSIDSAYDAKSGKALEIRAEVIQGFQQAATEQYMEDPLQEFSYSHARSSVQRFSEFLVNEPNALHSILSLENIDQSISHHGVTVAALSVAMAANSSVRDSHQIHLMALGCLLHDIEHYFSDFDLNRPVSSFSKEEMAKYKEHPLLGATRLQKATFVDQLVMKIIHQHEEHIDGSGFPQGLYEKNMDPLIPIVGTANAYDRFICFEKKAPKDALKSLLIDKLGAFPLNHLQNLQGILKNLKIVS